MSNIEISSNLRRGAKKESITMEPKPKVHHHRGKERI
jgi:hypothetical protein